MKAMIFAAGLGTRLRPLTNDKPKALVEYKGKALLQILIEKLINYNFTDIIINVHHFSQQIIDFIHKNNKFGINIQISDESEKLLDTGGGLFNAKNFFDNSPFLVHNVDIISDINLQKLYNYHLQNKPIATLATQNRNSSKRLYFNNEKKLCKWKNEITGQEKIAKICKDTSPMAFSGIQIIDPKIFKFMTPGVYSIIDTYLQIAKNSDIIYFDHSSDFWRDMGRPESFSF
jgi:NDP-sugar pyrophosphorylase family protein